MHCIGGHQSLSKIFNFKEKGNGKYDVIVEDVEIPYKNLEDLQFDLGTEAEVKFIDPHDISHKQRKMVFALLNDIEAYTGDPVELRRHILTQEFMAHKNIDSFSLSNCSMSEASEFIDFILAFIFKFNIPLRKETSSLMKEERNFLYFATITRKCVICGKSNSDLAHHYHIGRGMNRNEMNHYGYEVLALCREHHNEQHKIGIKTFDERYQLDNSWIKVDERLNRMLKGKKYKYEV